MKLALLKDHTLTTIDIQDLDDLNDYLEADTLDYCSRYIHGQLYWFIVDDNGHYSPKSDDVEAVCFDAHEYLVGNIAIARYKPDNGDLESITAKDLASFRKSLEVVHVSDIGLVKCLVYRCYPGESLKRSEMPF